MRKPRKDAQQTRHRLLEAASEIFADKGFWEASNADICKKAQVNTAAVSYHFGGKESLYVEAWRYAFERSMEAHPPDGGVALDAPVQDRLRGWILSFMQRIGDPTNREVEIMHKEMANPTGLLSEAIRQVMEPMHQASRLLIRELLGASADDLQISLCEMSIMGQCFGPMLRIRHARKSPEASHPGPLPLKISVMDLADHVVRFSLAGIHGVRRQDGQTRKNPRKNSPRNQRGSKQE